MVVPDSMRMFSPKLTRSGLFTLQQLIQTGACVGLPQALHQAVSTCNCDSVEALSFKAACSILADLADQQWTMGVTNGTIWVAAPQPQRLDGETILGAKQRLRQGLLVGRNRQLAEANVKAFIRKMERPRFHDGRWVSIVDLFDSGGDLAEVLRQVATLPEAERAEGLAGVIQPVLEVCSPDRKCCHTGLDLQDIWRYFRYTWSLEYRPTPGRTMQVLVRNGARPNSPVMGIATLASPCTRLHIRDEWIGWTTQTVEEKVKTGKWRSRDVATLLLASLAQSTAEIRWDDLVTPQELESPSVETVGRLKDIAREAERIRMDALVNGQVELEIRDHLESVDWNEASARPLFRKKRAGTLADILGAKLCFAEAGLNDGGEQAVPTLLRSAKGRRAIEVSLGELRKRRLAANLIEASVCGAIHPYNEILAGKLVALLLASAEMQHHYHARYGNRISVISSQMAGRPIVRSSEIMVLTTTGLYGVGNSQYNRLVLHASNDAGLERDLHWVELGTTSGFGTAHLSGETVETLRSLSRMVHGVRRINNVFGEGASPRLRQIREGLDVLGIKADDVLRHSTPRIVYACECLPGARDQLMGWTSHESGRRPTVSDITKAWIRRWIVRRVTRSEVLDRMAVPSVWPGPSLKEVQIPPSVPDPC